MGRELREVMIVEDFFIDLVDMNEGK